MIKTYSTGRVATDPKLSYAVKGLDATICKFLLVSKRGMNGNNNMGEDLIPVICYDDVATFVYKSFTKGCRIVLDGEIRNYNYVDEIGVKHCSQVLLATNADYGDSKNESEKLNLQTRFCSPEKMEEYFNYMVENNFALLENYEIEKIIK